MKRLILFLIIFSSMNLLSATKHNMRSCMILPISDNIGDAISFKVYEDLEKYLKRSDWCYYRSNSEIINILKNYKKSLSSYIQNTDVLKLIAEKTKAGSLIKINLNISMRGVDIEVIIYGSSGDDLYFKESTQLNTKDTTVISQTIKNWLDVYEKTIPFDGSITGIIGDQFTVNMGRSSGVQTKKKVDIVRPIRIKKHPLLKEIVEWEVEKIAEAKIIDVTNNQSQAKITVKYKGKRIQKEDWIRLSNDKEMAEEIALERKKNFEFGKLGNLSLYFYLGSISDTVLLNQSTTKEASGFGAGLGGAGEVWITRNMLAVLSSARVFGGEPSGAGYFLLKGGYRFLPLGFFFGPQVDAYVGYAEYFYSIDTNTASGFVGANFSGLLLGTKANIPLKKGFRIYLALDFIFDPTYQEDVALHGEDDSTSNYALEIGGNYSYSPTILLDASVEIISSTANFKDPAKKISFSNTSLKLGATLTF